MVRKRWLLVGAIVLICLGIIFGDTKRFHHLCITPILELVGLQDTHGDRTDASLHLDTEDDNHSN